MSEQNSTEDGDPDPQHSFYMLFLLVLVFFVMGLGGFLICHILKKKGYRCRTFSDELDSEKKESLTQLQDDEDEELNEDTVEKIVKCIIQNEANVEVLKEMLADGDADLPLPVPVPSGLCPHRNSQDGGVPHHHTVHLGSTQAPCIHCSRKKRHPLHRQGRSKEGKSKMHPGETTVFSVGRFHVTHIGKKPGSHDSQRESLPNSKQDLYGDQESHNSEKHQWEGSQNGIVHMDGLQQERFQQEDSTSESERRKDDCTDAPTQGENPLNETTNSDVPMSDPERKEHLNTGSLQEMSLLGTTISITSDQKLLDLEEQLVSEDLEETKRLNMKADHSDGNIQRAANKISESERSQVLQGGSRLDLSGNVISRTKSTEHEEQNLVVQDPRVSV
ncbi:RELT-like protein 2 isoform X2 [Hemicordylus capensis]|uniref:RELT-like protein 2 isoform X2 n=1 Tax=Hemicordylus capensis TaxID=884348 RepID=UPI0023024727|nr:RELT-like protein 2 isoform X2 [Hemicordylus capensis]XP_053106242.1 RELT-like protein 2 isoform X2 [Hemicordylus capensis]